MGRYHASDAIKLLQLGQEVMRVDPSTEGIALANARRPQLKIFEGSACDDLSSRLGLSPAVTSLKVVEHVYAPLQYAAMLYSLLESGGAAIVPTPYHGYWKNPAIQLFEKMNTHFTALWDHGYIKILSIRKLSELLREPGFIDVLFQRVSRIPHLAKSMIFIARKS